MSSSKLMGLLEEHLSANSVTKDEFIEQLVQDDWGDKPTVTKVVYDKAEPCVGIVAGAQKYLSLSDEQATRLEMAGRQDAREGTHGKRKEYDGSIKARSSQGAR